MLASTDCNDNNARMWSIPSEVPWLRLMDPKVLIRAKPSEPGGTILWFDLLRAASPEDFFTNTICLASNTFMITATESEDPRPDQVFYCLVRGENCCPAPQNIGPLGFGSDGTRRDGRICP